MKSVLLQQMGTNTETNSQTDIIQRVRDPETHSLKGDISIKSLCSGIRGPCKRGGRKSVRGRGDEDTKKTRPLNQQHDKCSYEFTETEAAYTEPAQVCARWGPTARRRSGT